MADRRERNRRLLREAFGKRRSKYGNVRIKFDGYTFDSKVELRRYKELKLLERGGAVSKVLVHPCYPFHYASLDGERRHGFDYIPDFQYFDERGRLVIEDVKGGNVTDLYALKKRLIEGYYGFEIKEIRYRK